jgi:hypothetical protein
MCRQINLNNHFDDMRLDISNVPGATSYNVYASPAPNGCSGPFGLATNIPVIDPVQNDNTNPCPAFTGNGCSLGNVSKLLSADLDSPFAPNAAAAPGTVGAYPPDRQTAPLASGLPNQNPGRGSAAAGDRANENNCKSVTNVYVTCPGPVTPGAVLLNFPAGGCLVTGVLGDTYVFSGYQYNWMSFYSAPGNGCTHTFGAAGNSAWIGMVYAPGATIGVTAAGSFRSPGMGGVIADNVTFTGSLPAMSFNAIYAPTPPAARITS